MSAITGIPGLRRLRRACATLALSAAIGAAGGAAASAQSMPLSGSFSRGVIGYAFARAAVLDFVGGGQESGYLLGAGLMLGTLGGASSSFPELSYGIELDSLNLTGTGTGWGVDRLRGVVRTKLDNRISLSFLLGPARLRMPLTSATGFSAGLNLEIDLLDVPQDIRESTLVKLTIERALPRVTFSIGVDHNAGFGLGLDSTDVTGGFNYYF